MTLLDRVAAATKCLVQDCDRHRAPDAQVCESDLTELYLNRLDRRADGTFLRRRLFVARDMTRAA